MSLSLLIFWIVGVSAVTLSGSWYARRFGKPDLLIGLYVTFILVAQLLATKIAAFDFGFQTFFGPAGVIVFSITFLLTDIVNEKFGRVETQRMIFIGFFSQVAMVFFFWLGTSLPAAPFWTTPADVWSGIFGAIPRITVASWVAFLISENVDAYMFAWFKQLTGGKHLWMRNAFSSIPSLALDSLIFIPLAFLGVPGIMLWPLIWGQLIVKWLVGVISIPFMYANDAILKG